MRYAHGDGMNGTERAYLVGVDVHLDAISVARLLDAYSIATIGLGLLHAFVGNLARLEHLLVSALVWLVSAARRDVNQDTQRPALPSYSHQACSRAYSCMAHPER